MKHYFVIIISIFVHFQVYAQESILKKLQNEIQNVSQKISYGIVKIECEKEIQGTSFIRQQFRVLRKNSKDWEQYYQNLSPKKEIVKDSGTGFIIDKSGYILTNDFIKNAYKITVTLNTGEVLPAKIKGIDNRTHIALLKIKHKTLTPIQFGNSDIVKMGTLILSVGNPYGISQYASLGIISGKQITIRGYPKLPFSLPIQPGDSGGAIFDIEGKLIGLIDSIIIGRGVKNGQRLSLKLYDPKIYKQQLKKKFRRMNEQIKKRIADDFKKGLEIFGKKGQEFLPKVNISFSSPKYGISMATPINLIKPIIASIKNHGKVRRGWIGITATVVSPILKAQIPQLHNIYALQIDKLDSEGPAKLAGLRKWDIIMKFANQTIKSLDHFRKLIETTIGKTTIVILRQGKVLKLPIYITKKN